MADHLLSDLVGSGGGVRTVQTGYLSAVAMSTGTGEDSKYYDVTLPTAVIVAKCRAEFQGTTAVVSAESGYLYFDSTSPILPCTARVTGVNNLRISSVSGGFLTGRWYVVEYI